MDSPVLGFLADVKFGAVLLSSRPWSSTSNISLAHLYVVVLLVLQVTVSSVWVSRKHRLYFLRLVFHTCCLAPMAPVSFSENLFADFLTSIGRPLKDLAYTGCYLSHWRGMDVLEIRSNCHASDGLAWYSLQLILVMPLVIRVSQCIRRIRDTGVRFPHLLNCGKYATAIFVSILAAARLTRLGLSAGEVQRVRIAGYFLATVYAATWDLAVDFGLSAKGRRCLFPGGAYIAVAILDVCLRSTWLLTYLPDCRTFVTASSLNSECFSFAIGALELVRRALWATIRLEHEHLSNAGRFRSICWVPPLEHRRRPSGPDVAHTAKAKQPSCMRVHRHCSGQPSLRSRVAAIIVPVDSPASTLPAVSAFAGVPAGTLLAGASDIEEQLGGVVQGGIRIPGSTSPSESAEAPLAPLRPTTGPMESRSSRLGRSFCSAVAASAGGPGVAEEQATLCVMKAELQEYNGLLAMDQVHRHPSALVRLKSL